MDLQTVKERLHEYIESADEQHLSAIYVLVNDSISSFDNNIDEETMKIIYQRRENHENGISKSYTVEEAINIVRQNKK